MNKLITVGMADDDLLVRRALGALIAEDPGLSLRWAVEDGQRAVDLVLGEDPEQHVDVLLLDLQMPVLGGIEACRRVQASRPGFPVILLTTFEPSDYLAEALAAGACGFLTKDETPDRIADAVRAAVGGTGVFSPRATRALRVPALGRRPAAPAPNPLTDKENQVMLLVAESCTNRQIGRRLGISEATVKSHVSSIITKLDCVDRVGIVAWAFRNGVL